jgi:hypothetical protein
MLIDQSDGMAITKFMQGTLKERAVRAKMTGVIVNDLKNGANSGDGGSFRALRAIMCYVVDSMALYKNNAFSRRLPDIITEELVLVLSQKIPYEFKQLFVVLHDNLRRRNAANGGAEMLRLRAYEKLQNLVSRGAVKKNGKIYTGNSAALAAMAVTAVPAAPAVTSDP